MASSADQTRALLEARELLQALATGRSGGRSLADLRAAARRVLKTYPTLDEFLEYGNGRKFLALDAMIDEQQKRRRSVKP